MCMNKEYPSKETLKNNTKKIARILKEAGCNNIRFEVHEDGSGRLALGYFENNSVTEEQLKLAQKILRSNRPYEMICPKCIGTIYGGTVEEHKHVVGVTTCHGFIEPNFDV